MKPFAAALLLIAAGAPAQTPPAPAADPNAAARAIIADVQRIVTPHGVQERFVADIGGARQVVSVRGADRANPILLFIHGGPGATEMPVAWTFERPWEDFFTVVQWDQRGAGASYPLNDPAAIAPTMTLERYRDDTIALIELLDRRYGKRKVILVGHSWGSLVGLAVAARRPDLLHAYVGIGQMIDVRANEQVQYDWTLAEARRRGDRAAVAELEAIRPYPGTGAIDPARTEVLRRWSIRYGGLAAGRDNANFYFHAPRLSPEYSAAERAAMDDGSAFTIRTVWPSLPSTSMSGVHRLATPVILFLGRHDQTVPAEIAADWMARLSAPQKHIVWFENSAHLPMVEEPGRTFAALLRYVRPIAVAAGDGPSPP